MATRFSRELWPSDGRLRGAAAAGRPRIGQPKGARPVGAFASRDATHNLDEVERFLAQVRVLPFGKRSAAIHARLRWELRSHPIGPNDLVVAATTLAAGAALATANVREFGRIQGLRVESWR